MIVDYEVQRIAEGEMGPDERLVWCGRPNPNRALGPGLCVMLFGIPFTLFAVFWIATAFRIGGEVRGGFGGGGFGSGGGFDGGGGFSPTMLFPLFGIPFVLAGIALLTAPIWMARRLRNTAYALTNRRALIITQGRSRSVQSFTADTMGDLERRERPDGSGDLIFTRRIGYTTHHDNFHHGGVGDIHGHHGHHGHHLHGTHTHARTQEIGFFGVPNVREVEHLLRQTLLNG